MFAVKRAVPALLLLILVTGCDISIESPDVHIKRAEVSIEKARIESAERIRVAEIAATREAEGRASAERVEIATAHDRSSAVTASALALFGIICAIGFTVVTLIRMYYYNNSSVMVIEEKLRRLEIEHEETMLSLRLKAAQDMRYIEAVETERKAKWLAIATRHADKSAALPRPEDVDVDVDVED